MSTIRRKFSVATSPAAKAEKLGSKRIIISCPLQTTVVIGKGKHFVPAGSIKYFWECKRCRLLPYQFRAPGSVVFSFDDPCASTPYVSQHLNICAWSLPLSAHVSVRSTAHNETPGAQKSNLKYSVTKPNAIYRARCDTRLINTCKNLAKERSCRTSNSHRQIKIESPECSTEESVRQTKLRLLSSARMHGSRSKTSSVMKDHKYCSSKPGAKKKLGIRLGTKRLRRIHFTSINERQVEI
mmetsp:Transcript_19554/g.23966  ORF Transcript_19554/g.23966 Transcript_19554/m.23966 type:complete len:240 (+) Transcript_19554:120-839(+)